MTPNDAPFLLRTTRARVTRSGMAVVLCLALTACGGDEARGRDAGGEEEGPVTTSSLFGAGDRPDEAEGTDERAGASSPDPTSRPSAAGPPASDDTQTVNLTDLGFTRGAADAPIRVVEFSDFGCGYCRKFHAETYPALEEEYIETGKVAWKYIPFVLGMFPNAVEAAMAGECAGAQDRFAVMRDRLFRDQGEWRKASDPYELFKRFAREEGLDQDRFARCVDERRPSERVRANIQAGRDVGVRGTPMFLVQGYPLQGALPLSVFRDVFDRVLDAGQEERGGGATGPGQGGS